MIFLASFFFTVNSWIFIAFEINRQSLTGVGKKANFSLSFSFFLFLVFPEKFTFFFPGFFTFSFFSEKKVFFLSRPRKKVFFLFSRRKESFFSLRKESFFSFELYKNYQNEEVSRPKCWGFNSFIPSFFFFRQFLESDYLKDRFHF